MTGFDEFEGFTRENHHELGRALIRNDQIEGISLDEHEKMVLGELVFGHCASIHEIVDEIRIERKNKKNETIRIQKLACLLRLADVCDASHNRASNVILACKVVDPISKVHHELHKRVSSIEFDNDSNKIIVYAAVKSEKDKELLNKTILNDIQKELCTSSRFLHPDITYNVVEPRISLDKFKKEITIPLDFNQQLQSHSCFKCGIILGQAQICEPMHENKPNLEHLGEHFDDVATKKSKIPILFGSSDIVKLQDIFNSRWITTFNVIETMSFKEIENSLKEGLPAIIVGNRDSGKTSFVYLMLKTFLLNNWHVAVYEKDESLDDEDFKIKSPLLIVVEDLHKFEIAEQDEIFKLYKKAVKNKCAFLATYRLENETNIGHLWNNEISQINARCVLPNLSIKELKQIIEVHSKEKGVTISPENIEQFAWQVSKYSNMPAHIAYSFLSKERNDIFSSDDIKKIPQKLNELIRSIIIKLDKNGENVMAAFKIFNILDGGDSRFVFKEELKYVFSKVNDGLSYVDFSRGLDSLLKLGLIQEIDSTIFTTPKEGFSGQISLELNKIDDMAIINALKMDYLNIFNSIDLNNKQDNQKYSFALNSTYDRVKKLEISVVDFMNLMVLKNKELARIILFKKAYNEPKDVQKIIFKSILPYMKELKDKKIIDLYQLANIYQCLDDIDNEIVIANEIISKNPDDDLAYHRLGHIFSNRKQISQAIEYMEKAASLNSEHFDCLARIYIVAKNYDKAIEFANKAIKQDPKSAYAYDVLGHAFMNVKNHALAIEHMEKAANLDPEYFSCLGNIYYNAGNIDKAIESAQKAIEHNPKNAQAYVELGKSFSDRENYALAIENMEKAANLNPEYFADLGKVHERAGNNDKAIESAQKAIEHNPKNAHAYDVLGHSLSSAKEHTLAIENMEKAANLDSRYFSCLGKIYYDAGNVDKAIDITKKAIEHNPKNAQACVELGHIFSNEKKHSQAIEYMEKAANLDPKNYTILGKAHEQAGNIDKAIESAQKAVDYNTKDTNAYGLLGSIFADELHNYIEAINYYNKILAINPQSNHTKANLIEAFLGVGRYEDVNSYAIEILDGSNDNNVRNLNVRFIVLCSKIFQGCEIDKRKLISDFLDYYEALPQGFENSWNYKGLIHMIEKTELGEKDHYLLISLIDLLKKDISIDKFKNDFLE